jgi:hypothetical protein
MRLRPPDLFLGRFRERDTPILRATVEDNSVPAAAIPGSALTTMTLTIYDEHTAEIVNDRAAVDIRANVDESGALEFPLTIDDMVTLHPTRRRERRRILLEWTWDTTQRASYEMQLVIENLLKVGSPA